MGLMHGTDVSLPKHPSGFGVQNLTHVVDEPDAFDLDIEAKQK